MNWQHLRTILWLRSRLSRNQWRRAGKFAAVLRILFRVLGVILVLGGALGGLLLGLLVLGKAPVWVGWLVLTGLAGIFLFVWLIGVAAEVQRAEAIDIQRLLHLPISLNQVFVLNYVASLVTPSVLLIVPAMFGVIAGMAFSRGMALLWFLPAVLAWVFMTTAWTYCLRGWLVALMVNKRRRRTIVVGLTVGIILLGQVPNLLFNNPYTRNYIREQEKLHRQEQKERAQGRDRDTARESSVFAAVFLESGGVPLPWWGMAGLSLAGFLAGLGGLNRAYGMTLRFYTGVDSSRSVARRKKKRQGTGRRSRLVEGRIPGCSDEVSAMALTFLRSSLRAPETKMAMVMPLVMVVVFGSLQMGRGGRSIPDVAQPFVLTGVVAFAIMSMTQLAANVFGSDRNGFRALVLLPVRRRSILFAKNLSMFPLLILTTVVLLVVASWLWGLSPFLIVAGLVQCVAGHLLLSIIGNFTSVKVPFRVAPGSLKPTKTSPKRSFMLFITYLLIPLAMIPLVLPAVFALLLSFLTPMSAAFWNLTGSVALLGGVVVGYKYSLDWSGEQLRSEEQRILEIVTSPIE